MMALVVPEVAAMHMAIKVVVPMAVLAVVMAEMVPRLPAKAVKDKVRLQENSVPEQYILEAEVAEFTFIMVHRLVLAVLEAEALAVAMDLSEQEAEEVAVVPIIVRLMAVCLAVRVTSLSHGKGERK